VIRVAIELRADGTLEGIEVSGHGAAGADGASVPCAAASALARTAALLLEERGYPLAGGAPGRGELRFRLQGRRGGEGERGWLRGIADFLVRGFRGIEDDYPRECDLTVRTRQTEE
jgi:uncharacterized protein YsxB (DUF464 family)